jgi:rhamnose transport system permease protein
MSGAMGAINATVPPAAPSGPDARRLVDVVLRARELGIVAALAALVIVTTALEPRFLDSQNIEFILSNTTIFAFLAVGEAMVVISRNVDLSVGSVLGLSAYLSSNLFTQVHGIPVPLVFLVGLAIGLVCGVLNGAVVAIGRVPSLVVTLASLYIIRGVDVWVVGGGQVVANNLPSSFLSIGTSSIGPVPVMALGVGAVVAVASYYMKKFRSGRELYAIGSNPDAAVLAGLRTGRRVFVAFAVSGAIAGLAGVLWAADYGTIDSTAGTNYELQVVAAVVVGGVAIFGGSGTIAGAALGALLLESINTALYVLGVSPFWDSAIAGFLLIVAIALDKGISTRLTGALRKRNLQYGT